MKVIRVKGSPECPRIVTEVAPQPQLAAGEVLIRVCAAGVILTELGWFPTWHDPGGAPREGSIPSHEFSGIVAATAPDVTDFVAGQPVYGMNDWHSDGALAEYCRASVAAIAPKPPSLTFPEAASIPISALTAWQGLFEHAKLQAGDRLLVQGGAGGVGAYAVQLAYSHGANVTATASADDLDFVTGLGASEVLDYRITRPTGTFDVIFDTVGGDVLDASLPLLKPSGRLVAIAATPRNNQAERVQQAFFIVRPDGKQLRMISRLFTEGHLRPDVRCVVPLDRAADVYRFGGLVKGRGKAVVMVSEAD